LKNIIFSVFGKVQAVFFRQSSLSKAEEIGLSGWIKNNSDGSVSGCAQGNEAQLDLWKNWLHSGPEMARVDTVEWANADEVPMNHFEIR